MKLEKYETLKEKLNAVKKNPYEIAFMINPDLEIQLEAVKRNPMAITFINQPAEQTQELAVSKNLEIFAMLKKPSSVTQKIAFEKIKKIIAGRAEPFKYDTLSSCYGLLKHKNFSDIRPEILDYVMAEDKAGRLPLAETSVYYAIADTEELQLKVIEALPERYNCLKNPSDLVTKLAIKRCGMAIRYVKEPTSELARMAFKTYPEAFMLIKKPTEEEKILAIKQAAYLYEYVKNPTAEMKKLAIMGGYSDKFFIKTLSPELLLLAIQVIGPHILENFDELDPKFQAETIKTNATSVLYIKNVTDANVVTAVTKNPGLIKFIKNPSEAAQLAAVTNDPTTLTSIKKPTPAVQLAAVTKLPTLIQHCSSTSDEIIAAGLKAEANDFYYYLAHVDQTKISDKSKVAILLKKE